MAKSQKTGQTSSPSNINNNNININVTVDPPSKTRSNNKFGWLFKAIITSIIALLLPFLWNYVKNFMTGGSGNPPVIINKPN